MGVLAGWLVWGLMRWIQRRWHLPQGHYTRLDVTLIASSVGVTVTALLFIAFLQAA